MNITKKTAFGATAAAAALVVVGIAGPAMASDHSSDSPTNSYNSNTETPVVIAPDVKLLNGDNFNELLNALNGGIGNGNAIASGNDITAPIASGNDTAIGNVSGIANGNDISTDASTDASDAVDNATGVSDVSDVSGVTDVTSNVSDVTSNASDLVGDITDSVNLEGILGR